MAAPLCIEGEIELAEEQEWKLWYGQPADKWEEALPLGNGRLGAMVFGRITSERIQWNEDTLWSGFPRDTHNYDALRYLAPVRERIASGRYEEAEKLIEEHMVGRRTESFLPLGDLIIEQEGISGAVTGYRRELDLDAGMAAVRWVSEGRRYSREMFISAVDQVAVIRYEADADASLDLTIRQESLLKHHIRETAEGILRLFGHAPSHIADNYRGDHPQSVLYEEGRGLRYEMQLLAQVEGGHARADSGMIRISNASSVTLLVAAATDFEGFDQMPGAEGSMPSKRCEQALLAAAQLGYEQLRDRHLADHRALFRRVELRLGPEADGRLTACKPTDERLKAYREGGADPALEALLFQYGRYLLMGSSRPGTQPAHLQGIWNPHVQPPWNSDYTTNINTEMNYWPAEVANLSECHEPLIRMIGELSVHGSRTAHIHYGCRGWTAHHNVDLWRMSTPSDGSASWAFWPMGGVWLSRHLWEHYRYNPDLEYLRQTAYPLMKGAALFCLDWLVEDEKGRLMTSPSTSPENRFLTEEGVACSVSAGSTMDMALMRELFHSFIEASEMLDDDRELREELRQAAKRLLPYQIDAEGRLMEWSEPFAEAEPGHRHVSHLYGLYPGEEITPEATPELAAAAERSLASRIRSGGGHTGWSCAWLINLYARLGQPEAAYTYVRTLLSRSVHKNLLGDHPPFQIDANFGGAAGVAEMLLQSHGGVIRLLPALPAAWEAGAVHGLKARGGFVVAMAWSKGALDSASVISTHGQRCTLVYHRPLEVADDHGSIVAEGESCTFETQPGKVYVIRLLN